MEKKGLQVAKDCCKVLQAMHTEKPIDLFLQCGHLQPTMPLLLYHSVQQDVRMIHSMRDQSKLLGDSIARFPCICYYDCLLFQEACFCQALMVRESSFALSMNDKRMNWSSPDRLDLGCTVII